MFGIIGCKLSLIYTILIKFVEKKHPMINMASMTNMIHKILFHISILLVSTLLSCSSNGIKNNELSENNDLNEGVEKKVTIFFVNDQHAHLDNFAKIKYLIDKEKETKNVIVACSGDMFSGSPVVDNYKDDQGFPMIDVMNKVGFDVSVLGNHEFDYGEATLKKRIEQANFNWVCANVDMLNSGVPQPNEFYTVSKNDIKITFLGLVETNGKKNGTIPSTHPWKVKKMKFERPETVVNKYKDVKKSEDSDLFIALTHLGHTSSRNLGDVQLANKFPYFDLIIGGHSHQEINTKENGIPIYQSGSYLKNLGKIELSVKNKSIISSKYTLINLEEVLEYDQELKSVIDTYNNVPELEEVIGNSLINHQRNQVGCLYADALKATMNVTVSFQNTGGIRSSLNQGAITKRDIYTIEPFNNGTVKYEMTIGQIKNFLIESKSGFYYSGIQIKKIGRVIEIRDELGNLLDYNTVVSVGLNDYIPAVYDNLFPEYGDVQNLSAASSIISYIKNTNPQVNYPNCGNYFRY
ncbi:bifunctional metallophosphatase/5'-nucleotidase [Tenacibaculum finnmarkense]|uniref:bifunctional metallophosphatase/5'-nucleotidase n=1 Tax=Tenacibaculum finnmarkense TaxID=2781243 RepID=UPI00187BAD00|nr:bifunctional UDP-sugar hydrolase/5'-nucleotidase [Tenacibaculum finnmarkense]MBE7648424.1 hypothetical protein [Tenacibaculum finnmarkense genomovar ulcerans]